MLIRIVPFAFGRVPEQTVTIFAYDPSGEIQKAASQKGPQAPQ